jgi:hypothetical protein
MNRKATGGTARWRAWPQTLTVGVALLTAACGGAATARSTPASGTSATPVASPTSSDRADSAEAAFAQCMRTHGDPSFGPPPTGPYVQGQNPASSPEFQKARKACISLATGNGHVSGGDSSGGQ